MGPYLILIGKILKELRVKSHLKGITSKTIFQEKSPQFGPLPPAERPKYAPGPNINATKSLGLKGKV